MGQLESSGSLREISLKRRTLLGLMGAGGVAALAGCSSPSASPSAGAKGGKSGGTFRLGLEGGGSGSPLDPHRSFSDPFNSFIATAFYEQMAIVGNTGSVQNVLLDELTPNKTGQVWTARVKSGVEFHNGKTLDADDIIFTCKRILDPKTSAVVAGQFAVIQDMKKVDARTVQFTLKQPQSWFDINISDGGLMGVVPAGFDSSKPISTGPFKLVEYDRQGTATFERFKNYHGTAARFDQLQIKGISDDDSRLNALISNQLDAARVAPLQANQVEQTSGYGITNIPSSNSQPLIMRVDDGPLANVELRQALRYALDRKQVVDVVYGGRATLASDVFGIYDPAFDSSLKRSQDLKKAKELAKASGIGSATVPLTVTALFQSLAQVMAENAKEAGINVKVNVLDDASYDAKLLSWDFSADGFPLTHVLSMAALTDGPGAAYNETHFNDKEYNSLFDEASKTTDVSARDAIVKKMQQIQFDRGGFIVPVFMHTIFGYSKKVTGWIDKDASGLGVPRSLNQLAFTS